MKAEDVRLFQRVRWLPDVRVDTDPVGEIIGCKVRFARSPENRAVSVTIMFDQPLWKESIFGPTRELSVPVEHLELAGRQGGDE